MRKDQGVVSRILNGERSPKNETLKAIARSLKLSNETVFRAAGLLPPKPEEDQWVDEQSHKLSLLTPDKRSIAEKLLNALLEEDKHMIPVGRKARAKT